APDWLIEFVTNGSAKLPTGLPTFTVEDLDLRTAPGVGEGSRHSMLCRLVGSHLAAQGLTSDLLQLAEAWAVRCTPPMPADEAARVVASLANKHIGNAPSSTGTADTSAQEHDLQLIPFSEIDSKPVSWLWKGRLAIGKLTLLTGEGGVGK